MAKTLGDTFYRTLFICVLSRDSGDASFACCLPASLSYYFPDTNDSMKRCWRRVPTWHAAVRTVALHFLVPWGTFVPIFIFLRFCFWVTSPYGADGQTDGRAKRVMRPIGRPHNDDNCNVNSSSSSSSSIYSDDVCPMQCIALDRI